LALYGAAIAADMRGAKPWASAIFWVLGAVAVALIIASGMAMFFHPA
jgi:hypothetical protein